MTTTNTLAARLRDARINKGLSQYELARLVNISQATIAALESERNMGSTHIAKLSAILDVNPLWLETGKGERNITVNQAIGAVIGNNTTIQGNQDFSVRQTIVNNTKKDNEAIIMPDNSMYPIIPQGSELWIDEKETTIYDNKTYWLTWQGRPAPIARCLVFNPNGLLDVIAHNKDVSNHTIEPEKIQILGRVVAWKVLD